MKNIILICLFFFLGSFAFAQNEKNDFYIVKERQGENYVAAVYLSDTVACRLVISPDKKIMIEYFDTGIEVKLKKTPKTDDGIIYEHLSGNIFKAVAWEGKKDPRARGWFLRKIVKEFYNGITSLLEENGRTVELRISQDYVSLEVKNSGLDEFDTRKGVYLFRDNIEGQFFNKHKEQEFTYRNVTIRLDSSDNITFYVDGKEGYKYHPNGEPYSPTSYSGYQNFKKIGKFEALYFDNMFLLGEPSRKNPKRVAYTIFEIKGGQITVFERLATVAKIDL